MYGRKSRKESHHHLGEIAFSIWGPNIPLDQRKLDSSLVDSIYQTLSHATDANRAITSLEVSQYLENYLWPNFEPENANKSYLMSIAVMINEKFKEHVPPWKVFQCHPEKFSVFFRLIMDLCLNKKKDSGPNTKERTILIVFLIHCFNSLEVELVRQEVQKLISLGIWNNLQPGRLEQELERHSRFKKYWTALHKKEQQCDEETLERQRKEYTFLFNLIHYFYDILESIPPEGKISNSSVKFCEKMLELLIDLESQPLTRRFFNTLLDDVHLVVRCFQSSISKRAPEGHLFTQLLTRLKFYCGFEINDHTGEALTEHEMMEDHYQRITSLQLASFKLFPELRSFALSNVAGVDSRDALMKHFGSLSLDTLHKIAAHLNLVPSSSKEETLSYSHSLLLEILIALHERRPSQLESLNSSPLYPTEDILWDQSIVPYEYFDGEDSFALPKLNLQFLTLHDYLLRNLTLFRLESTYEIREDIEDIVGRMKPWVTPDGETQFAGWARMSQPVTSFSIVEVGKPRIGENRPSRVRADVTFPINLKDPVKLEWEALRKHDVCFLITIKAKLGLHQHYDHKKGFAEQIGIEHVRGCEIEGMLDNEGKLIEEGPEPKPELKGDTRTFRVWLDTNQYQKDMEAVVRGSEDVYETFNVFARRKPKENNFKAVLETIRDLMNTECVVPDWIHDIFLGYGDPAAAHYTRMTKSIQTINFNDTFLSMDHLKMSFPQYEIECTTTDPKEQVPPFRITFPEKPSIGVKRKHPDTGGDIDTPKQLLVQPFTIPNRGPYPYNLPKKNAVPFTPTQVEAIRAGMQPGLTMVVGPPGTGKTDVAVQIISNLYHNFPEQRTLLVTHSNQALNQLFEKIMALDIDERHLLRLGHGEEELQTEKDFSRYGRVNFILALRLELLKEVERLQSSLDVSGDVSYTCETAGHFFLYQVLGRWEQYCSKIRQLGDTPEGLAAIREKFPFTRYFSNAPQPIFEGNCFDVDWDIAEGCFRHIRKIFKQLEEFRAFELLRTSRDRVNYLLVKEAKIIALTCTHAALKRKDLVELSFKYDNVLMEEAAQILEVETFVPLMLQNPADGFNRLKRVVMIGDHHQLPPVIKNMAFQKFSNMEQSMFTRFVRLGVPVIQLDAQGRARPSLCSLYKWRYESLGNLPHVLNSPEYQLTNPGFVFDYQLIDVEDFNGVGESTPTPYFFQNLGEAEYAVALFMYMRLQGYPPDKIAILTTYNGQKHLIRDVLNKRCARNPVFGLPEKVTTVDRYQGQQNDYIILSLVRTKHVGHIRDVRRLVVAMSRAKLGLYILARVSLFKRCIELQPAFDLLTRRPQSLHLLPNEYYPPVRHCDSLPNSPTLIVSNMPHLAQLVYQEYQTRVKALQASHRMAPPPVETIKNITEDEVVVEAVETNVVNEGNVVSSMETEEEGIDNKKRGTETDDTSQEVIKKGEEGVEMNVVNEGNVVSSMETEEEGIDNKKRRTETDDTSQEVIKKGEEGVEMNVVNEGNVVSNMETEEEGMDNEKSGTETDDTSQEVIKKGEGVEKDSDDLGLDEASSSRQHVEQLETKLVSEDLPHNKAEEMTALEETPMQQ